MSFSFTNVGTVEEVRAAVADVDVYGNLVGLAAKKFIDDVLDMQGETRVSVEASGHSGNEPGGLVEVKVSIRPAL